MTLFVRRQIRRTIIACFKRGYPAEYLSPDRDSAEDKMYFWRNRGLETGIPPHINYCYAILHAMRRVFAEKTGAWKSVFFTLLTTFGAKPNEYYLGVIQNQITLDGGCEMISCR